MAQLCKYFVCRKRRLLFFYWSHKTEKKINWGSPEKLATQRKYYYCFPNILRTAAPLSDAKSQPNNV